MKILPPELTPPTECISHSHEPNPAEGKQGYQAYLPCLRWDFGFTCAFCLLHETDLSPKVGAAKTGQMSIEHHTPKSTEPSKKNRYSNCLYACTRCNTARATRPTVNATGKRLLNPAKVAWSEHFSLNEKSEIHPRKRNADARYTHDVYDLNEPKKVARRRHRKEFYNDRLPLFSETSKKIRRLFDKAVKYQDRDPELFDIVIEAIGDYRDRLKTARLELSSYPAIPPDAPSECRCSNAEHHSLPPGLARQMIDLP